MNKKILPIFALASVFVLVGCDKTDIIKYTEELDRTYHYDANGLRVDVTSLSMFVDETREIHTVRKPSLAYDAEVLYRSEDEDVCTVDEDGTVTATGEGKTTIVAYLKNDETVYQNIPVNVLTQTGKTTALQDALDAQGLTQLTLYPTAPEKIALFMSERRTTLKEVTDEGGTSEWVAQLDEYGLDNFVLSKDEAFFQLHGYYETTKTAHGVPEISDYQYIMYTDEGRSTHLYHESSGSKNRMSIKTTSFIGQPKVEALYATLDALFNGGKKIMTQYYDFILARDELINYSDRWRYTPRGGIGDGQVRTDYERNIESTATPEEEEAIYIPSGTPYKEVYHNYLTWENGLIRTEHVYFSIAYTVKGENMKVVIDRWYTYYSGEEVTITYPNPEDYKQVYEIFDL